MINELTSRVHDWWGHGKCFALIGRDICLRIIPRPARQRGRSLPRLNYCREHFIFSIVWCGRSLENILMFKSSYLVKLLNVSPHCDAAMRPYKMIIKRCVVIFRLYSWKWKVILCSDMFLIINRLNTLVYTNCFIQPGIVKKTWMMNDVIFRRMKILQIACRKCCLLR